MSSASSPVMPWASIPSYSFVSSRSIFSRPRLEPMARRSRSASSPVQPPMVIAICISCSWNSGTPRVRFSTGSSAGCR